MNKRFLLILALCIVGLGAIFWFTREEANAPGDSGSNPSVQSSKHTYGSGGGNVTLIEYGDFECPACGAYYPIVKTIKEKYKDDITFQFRHFPLVQIHQNAFAASRAAEAAGMQNKFWEMHDLIYEQQTTWKTNSSPYAYFEGLAGQLGLNVTKFKTDYSSSVVNNVINADIKEGKSVGADSTPTFVLNGKKIDKNPATQEAFEKLIDDAIAAKNKQGS